MNLQLKNIVLFVTALLSAFFTNAAEIVKVPYNTFIEEGKTWWYRSYVYDKDMYIYYNFTLEGDEIIDDVAWKKCWYRSNDVNICETPIVLFNEENNTLSLYVNDQQQDIKMIDNAGDKSYYQDVMNLYFDIPSILKYEEDMEDNIQPITLFDLNIQVNAKLHWFWSFSPDVYIANTRIYENDKHIFNSQEICYAHSWRNDKSEAIKHENCQTAELLSGIGLISYPHIGLFFNPFPRSLFKTGDYDYFTKPQNPELLYVTDADNNIIFEGVGGRKPWEPDGVESVNDESLSLAVHDGMIRVNNNESNKEISLSIYSADGSVVAFASGTGKVEYPLTGLQKGVYIVKAVAGNSAGKTIRVMI